MTSTAGLTRARTTPQLSNALTAASTLPDQATCCQTLEVIFSPNWKDECACTEAMRVQTSAYPSNVLRRLATIASTTCPSAPNALRRRWSWRSCSLGNTTYDPVAASSIPPVPTGSVLAYNAISAASAVPATWNQLVDIASGRDVDNGRELLQSCTLGDCYSSYGAVARWFCSPGYGHCTGSTCTYGSSSCIWYQAPFCLVYVCCKLSNCVACFPGSSTVRLESGTSKAMSELAIGDRVQVVDPATGKLGYEEVYLFGHQLADVAATFVKATLANGKILTLSPDHFVPAIPMGKAVMFKNTVMVRGKDLRVGMHVFAADSTDVTAASMVEDVSVAEKQGLFNPYTMGGMIVVDGVVASAHSSWLFDSLMDGLGLTHKIPALYQALFAPIRTLYRIVGASHMAGIAPTITDFGNAVAEGDVATAASMLARGACAMLAPALAGVSAYVMYYVAACKTANKA